MRKSMKAGKPTQSHRGQKCRQPWVSLFSYWDSIVFFSLHSPVSCLVLCFSRFLWYSQTILSYAFVYTATVPTSTQMLPLLPLSSCLWWCWKESAEACRICHNMHYHKQKRPFRLQNQLHTPHHCRPSSSTLSFCFGLDQWIPDFLCKALLS